MAKPLFERADRNPLLTTRDLPFRAAAVLNPGAIEQNGEMVLLLRVEDVEGYSSIHVARSSDGVTGWRIEAKPLLAYGGAPYRYEAWGCEDARVCKSTGWRGPAPFAVLVASRGRRYGVRDLVVACEGKHRWNWA